MYLLLLVVGLLVAAAGFVTIGFGIPINAFSLGNTLIIAGTTAVVGGLLLVGMAAAVRSLQRVAEALGSSPAPRPARASEPVELPHVPPTAQLGSVGIRPQPQPPAPPKPSEPAGTSPLERRPGEIRPPEPPPPPAPPPSEVRGPLDWLRPRSKQSDPTMMTVSDEASRQAPRPAAASSPMAEPVLEPKGWSPGRNGSEEPRPVPRSEQVARATEEPVKDKDQGLFDVVWPAARPATGPVIAPARPAAPAPSALPGAPKRSEPAPAGSASERSPAILKSGVIDGMAYTLYADGSIEAELPQGTIKFASIDALRAHLEKHGG